MKKIFSLLCAVTLFLSLSMTVFANNAANLGQGDDNTSAASSISSAQAYDNLKQQIKAGKVDTGVAVYYGGRAIDYIANTYPVEGGGYFTYGELTNAAGNTVAGNSDFFVESRFSQLTSKGKRDFLRDMLDIAYAHAYATQYGYTVTGINEETVNTFLSSLQNKAGMGSTVLSTVLKDYKPDFVSGNRILSPMMGVINTVVGVISLLIFMLLGAVMALDIAYIMIPALQLAFDGAEGKGGEGQNGATKKLSKIVSIEAHKAVEAASDGSAAEYKAPIGIYFGMRWKGLVVLGICLILLINGLIYPFIGSFLDLFTGFLGF